MEYGLALIVLLAAVAAIVAIPILRGPSVDRSEDEERAALEAAKEAKYREIRDAELDRRMGKLSDEDWRATDRELRAQAIEILRRIDELPEADAEHAGDDR
jgi:flagellar biosynthesis/type III secretory pathway M-ring protein FliF/YscJ